MQNTEPTKYYDLTRSQLLIWTGQQISPSSPMYNMALAFELPTQIDETKFVLAFQKLLALCDAMRTVFVEKDGKPQQKILTHLDYQMPIEDFSQHPEKSIFLKNWLAKRSQWQFDITECLLDSVLIKMSTDQYVWYFNEHHLITDAWATTLKYQVVATAYQHLVEGKPTDDLSFPLFEDYIKYEAAQSANPTNRRAKDHWANKAKELPVPPAFFGNSNLLLNSHSQRVSLRLSKAQSDTLRQLTKESDLRTWTEHLSLFSIFSTLLLAYLYRITGQQKLAIGTPAHNRSTTDFKKTPGLFIELFPLMTNVSALDTFSSLFQKVKDETLEFLRYAQAGVSNPDLNRGFNVVLNYINASFADFNGTPMESTWIHSSHADPGHHIRLQVHDFDASGRIELCFDLNTTIFNEKQIQSIPHQFLNLLESFVEDRFQLVNQPALVTSDTVAIETHNNDFTYDDKKSVIDFFQANVAKDPSAIAVKFGEKELTYEELNHHTNQLAHFLIQNGVTPGERVAVLLPRSPEFLISIFAILKAGGVFVPIPTNYPTGRILGIIEDAQPKLVLSNSVLAQKLPTTLHQLVQLDKESVFIQQQSSADVTINTTLEDTAYIMYTSGSTGVPKGVMIGHAALSHYAQWAAHHYTEGFRPVVPLFTSVGFDLTITSIFLPMIAGGAIITYQEAEEGPDLSLFEVLEQNQVNFIKLTPSHLALLPGKSFKQSRIRSMIVGGENFKTDIAIFVEENFGTDLKILNEYGPTEATVGCVVHTFDPSTDTQHTSVPIGLPMNNVSAYILDELLNPVPEGVIGELYIGGIGLAQGYWRQEELTTQQFITSPFDANQKIYRTGDLVRKHPSQNHLEFFGRKDDQIKIRGRRVEVAEIETVLNQHPGVLQGVVELRHRQRTKKVDDVFNCVKCGLPSNYPSAEFNEEGVCHLCQSFTSYQEKVKKYFKTKADLKALFDSVPEDQKGEYDCIMLLSGGKDSSYAVAQLKEMGLKVLAFTLDNGYISQEAIANVKRVVKDIGVDYVIGQTDKMNEIFVDSLQRHCNVCDGCFKTIYTLSVQIALEKKIPFIVTGLSRGQFFETRLTEELFQQEKVDVDKIDEMILNARKAYHQVDDAVKRLLDVSMFENDEVFEKVRFVDFYRYTDVSLAEMLDYLKNKLPWVRPSDTGRSTNCLINQAGIYVHKKELGYSNYAFPYSWDVRIGHKTRQASLDEINEEIDEVEVQKILDEIGYNQAVGKGHQNEQLVAYFVGTEAVDEVMLKNYMLTQLPDYMVPVQFIPLDNFPLTVNGKVDRAALPLPDAVRPVLEIEYVEPQTEFEEIVKEVWSEVMEIDKIGIHDNFLAIGGDSLHGIRVISRLSAAFELELPVNLIFQKPTIAQIAAHIEETITKLLQELEG
ncbi:MAG: amino acid adenylation domain-containing protein [Bacteroidota bacterium]